MSTLNNSLINALSDSIKEQYNDGLVPESRMTEESIVNSDLTIDYSTGTGQIVGYSSDYEVNIRKLTSGYVLRVGCQEIAVENSSDVTKLIGIYLSGDKMVGDKWMTSDKNIQNFIKNNFDITK
jgi:phenolic acid decarboxylase